MVLRSATPLYRASLNACGHDDNVNQADSETDFADIDRRFTIDEILPRIRNWGASTRRKNVEELGISKISAGRDLNCHYHIISTLKLTI